LVKKNLKNRILDFILLFKDNIQNICIGTLLIGVLLGGIYYIMLSPQSIYSANMDDFPYEKKLLYKRLHPLNEFDILKWGIRWKQKVGKYTGKTTINI
jgi:hypothetical protein